MSDAKVRTFGRLLASLEDGELESEATHKLARLTLELIKQAENQGKAKGELTLKLKLSADSGGTVTIDGAVDTKEPKPLRARTHLWLDKTGALLNENPKQTKLPLREVGPVKPTREIESETQPPRSV
jgi:hypothetical protein